jgi:peptidoglycan LD-endopeptidase LytH
MKPTIKKAAVSISALAAIVIIVGLLIPERLIIPVRGATPADWNHNSFWFKPWGKSGVHREIDIFAPEGREVVSSCAGIAICADTSTNGGNIVAVLGPKWRVIMPI